MGMRRDDPIRIAGIRALYQVMDWPDPTMGEIIDEIMAVVEPLIRADENHKRDDIVRALLRDQREQCAETVEEYGAQTRPPWVGMESSHTVDERLSDAWREAIEGAARKIRAS